MPIELTDQECNALRAAVGGVDVYSYTLAKELRRIKKEHPGYLDICKPMNKGSGTTRPPYFGCILTVEGFKAVSGIKEDKDDD